MLNMLNAAPRAAADAKKLIHSEIAGGAGAGADAPFDEKASWSSVAKVFGQGGASPTETAVDQAA